MNKQDKIKNVRRKIRLNLELIVEYIVHHTFEVAFQGRTALPSTVTLTSVGRSMEGSNIKCGRACSYTIFDSLVVSIATPAA